MMDGMGVMDDEDQYGDDDGYLPYVYLPYVYSLEGGDPGVNWEERCIELEMALQRFRDQAGQIRGLLGEKVFLNMDELAEEIAVRLLKTHDILNYPNFDKAVNKQQRTKEGKVWFQNQVQACLATAVSQTELKELVKLVKQVVNRKRFKQKTSAESLIEERASFPRFYFVGDEDLLEIIDNRNNIPRMQKHFKKMFAGVAALLLNQEENIVLGIASREGEEVRFNTPVSTIGYTKVSGWLTLVEKEMRVTLAQHLADAVRDIYQFKEGLIDQPTFMKWIDDYPGQIVVLAAQIMWSEDVEAAFQAITSAGNNSLDPIHRVLAEVESTLTVLVDSVFQEQPALRRRKLEHLINAFIHQRTVTRQLIQSKVTNPKAFEWLSQMRFYFDSKQTDELKQLSICVANAKFQYGFEYLGVQDRLVQTPLTDRFYLTMTQALESGLGGSPFGPAGTGKTESVKALGHQLGRFVLVFNCDETFDFQAMGRIFGGLCEIGAWGCFDEFNRLEERMLSAVSQQVQTIQEALKSQKENKKEGSLMIELVGKEVKVSQDMAIFITMNPGYAGRSNLPDNLKKLFRSLVMTSPDRQLIAEVMLFSNGFRTAEKLAQKIVPFFKFCDEQLSNQSHYDFGLRALKSVLVSAGNVKRDRIQKIREDMQGRGETFIDENLLEQEILVQSVCELMVPKLVAEDIPLLFSLLTNVFPGIVYTRAEMAGLREQIRKVCHENFLVCDENDEQESMWMEKVIQIYQISQYHHGIVIVGPSGSGKSIAWCILLVSLERLVGTKIVTHMIDPKIITKEKLFGVLDPNTREWTDGVVTTILREINNNVNGEANHLHWIIFDSDIDPEWAENLNSVLDDNKLLTLPNGERLSIPPNVRIVFEVQDLKNASLATVSRCGVVWFSEDVFTNKMLVEEFFSELRNLALSDEEDIPSSGKPGDKISEAMVSPTIRVQRDVANILQLYFSPDGMVTRALEYATIHTEHVMDFTRFRALRSLFSMLRRAFYNVLEYNHSHMDFPMQSDQLERYMTKALVDAILWSFAGDGKLKARNDLGEFLRKLNTNILLPPPNMPIIDYEISIEGEWVPWLDEVPEIEVTTLEVATLDILVPTLDTVRHKRIVHTFLSRCKPVIFCGPTGSGKTTTIISAIKCLAIFDLIRVDFTSATSPELLLKTLERYCMYHNTPNGVIMTPVQHDKYLVFLIENINIPDKDEYGTQRVISFLRQIVQKKGFLRVTTPGEQSWVMIKHITFVGACNPPTDPGCKPLTHRLLNNVAVIYVDYPGQTSLKQIYGTFNRAILRPSPSLRIYADQLTNAMVEFYLLSQERFTQDMQPHYVYSLREMTRWARGISEAIGQRKNLSVENLVRLWAHEALRLFQDRLVDDNERKWTNENIDSVGLKHFPNINREDALTRPILFSNWLSKKGNYIPVDREELRSYVKARLKNYYEKELDVPLVLFDEFLDHVLRIDRIFRQPQGHLLLIGVSGAGKTTLSRFVAWMNDMSVFQVKVHNKYTAADFDEDLRQVLRRAGCKDEKICFTLDESDILESGFLERMNTLLANGEVPGLFEGDECTTLMTQCKEGAQREGLMLDSAEELYKWFTQQVRRNLHVIFTMISSSEGLKDRASTCPSFFNHFVINWLGDWSDSAFFQVGKELTNPVDLEKPNWCPSDHFPAAFQALPLPPTHRDAVINATVYFHQASAQLVKRGGHSTAITPRHYLDFINQFVKLYPKKQKDLKKQKQDLDVGLNKIAETFEQVEEMRKSLAVKSQELQTKNEAANSKKRQMEKDQNETNQKKTENEEIQTKIDKQTEEITIKKKDVKAKLDKIESSIEKARKAVKEINKQQLATLRWLVNPPKSVKLALGAVCLLLGEDTADWSTIRSTTIRENFISKVLGFSTEDISDDLCKQMTKQYLENPDYTFENVSRASVHCGPLVTWATAQVNCAKMLKQVEPLRNELKSLEEQADVNKKLGQETTVLISQLERNIASYKEEHALLISQVQLIEMDLKTVQGKLNRSLGLLKSLGIEKERWKASRKTISTQMSTIVGDTLLSSAFLAYAGYFDQQYRHNLLTGWSAHLQAANIQYRSDIARTEYLSNPDERLRWQANALPADELCTENAIMLRRFIRYPLIIDPSGQATKFIMNEFKDQKITRTSFLDDAFRENLESALRSGDPLLVEDVENYDPILNPVLERGLPKTKKRVLITLGNKEIDLSPSFTIFLSTRDPSVEFPPDICSRVTFVNFTVTRSSLQSQCLNSVLKAERPGIDEERSNRLKLQGECHLRLRQLEKSLLQALNDVKGKILDDDSVITLLETLKQEASEISKKVEETDKVIGEIETVLQQYTPLSQACSNIYFTLDSLSQVHFLYQYSLQFFLDIFHSVLVNNVRLKKVSDDGQRLSIVTSDLFQVVYRRVARGMLQLDRLTFAILLCRIHLRDLNGQPQLDAEFQHFLRGKDGFSNKDLLPDLVNVGLTGEEIDALARLSLKLPNFKGLDKKINESAEEFQQWLQHNTPETCVPVIWDAEKPLSAIAQAMLKLLVIQAVRPDRVVAAGHQLVDAVLSESFIPAGERELDLGKIVDTEVKSGTPVLLCSAPGFDASGRIDILATELNRQMTSIAIGSAEGFSQAEKAIDSAVETGSWVMLKNVHLAPQWLVQLEKKLHSLQPDANFRLFLTTEINPKIPVNLLRIGEVLVFGPPLGIQANLLRTFSAVPAARMMKPPKQRTRLHFLLAWFHAVVQERLRYCPLGWTKNYEFNESDLMVACDTLDTWIDTMALGRTNLPAAKVPWDALITLLSQCIYGGKIDNEFDQRLLDSILAKLFTPKSFETNFLLVSSKEEQAADSCRIVMPEGIRHDQFLAWIEGLSDRQLPAWLGLPNNAEKDLLTTRGTDMVTKLLKMQPLNDDDDESAFSASQRDADNTAPQRGDWMQTLLESARTWMGLLPDSLVTLRRTVENNKDPLYRFFEREVNTGARLLQDVHQDLKDVVHICQGEKKQTNNHRLMLSELAQGILPRSWRRYTIPVSTTVIQWITDFSLRIKQLQQVSQVVSQGGARELQSVTVWLGGLFNPEAYVTATRQCVAQANSWPLEEFTLEVRIDDQNSMPVEDRCFGLRGLKLQGAAVSQSNKLLLTSAMTDLSLIRLKWTRAQGTQEIQAGTVTLPVYLNANRTEILFTVDLSVAHPEEKLSFYERGVALFASTSLN